MLEPGRVYAFGGDTITARVVESGAPGARQLARRPATASSRESAGRSSASQASIGAPIVRRRERLGRRHRVPHATPDDPFPPGAEQRLGDFAALVAQAIVNAEARRETAALVAEQSALRRDRDARRRRAGRRRRCSTRSPRRSATLLRRDGGDARPLARASRTRSSSSPAGARREHARRRARLARTTRPRERDARACSRPGIASRSEESSPERERCSVIAAPVIINASLLGALDAHRDPATDAVPGGRGDQAAELRRPRGAVDRERARPGGAARVARAHRAHGRRDAPAARAQPARRRAAAARLGLGRAAAGDGEAAGAPDEARDARSSPRRTS